MNGGVVLCVEVDPERAARRKRDGWVDEIVDSVDEAVEISAAAVADRRPLSLALVSNAADAFPELLRRNLPVDIVTDQTSAHDPLNGYVPNDLSVEAAATLRTENPSEYVRRANRWAVTAKRWSVS